MMKNMYYPIAIEVGDETTAYSVVVPDIEGCYSAGDTLDEAVQNAQEAIDFHLETLSDDGIDIPHASALEVVAKKEEYKGYIWAVVYVDVTKYLGPSQKINVTLPGNLIRRIDNEVNSNPAYKSRSGFLQEAAIKVLSA